MVPLSAVLVHVVSHPMRTTQTASLAVQVPSLVEMVNVSCVLLVWSPERVNASVSLVVLVLNPRPTDRTAKPVLLEASLMVMVIVRLALWVNSLPLVVPFVVIRVVVVWKPLIS